LIAVFLNREKRIHELLAPEGAAFGVSILGEEQAEVSNCFAFTQEVDRFATGNWGTAKTGAPVLLDAVAWLDCVVQERQPAGSHVMVLGRVVESRVVRPEAAPLVYWNRAYRRLAEEA
jgi:flavin reductase ActVB